MTGDATSSPSNSTPASTRTPPWPSQPVRGEIIGHHPCPSCRTEVPHPYRPGRAALYCSNACRQRAYRWRRANGVRLCIERSGPAERSIGADKRHALRDRRDPAAAVVDPAQRTVSVCGTFVRPARWLRATHYDFLPDHGWSCGSCRGLIGDPDDDGVD